MLVQAFSAPQGADGQGFVQVAADPDDELPRVGLSGRGLGKRLPVFPVEADPFLDSLAELLVDLGLIVPVDAPEHEPRTRADIAMILFRPFDNFKIPITGFHSETSRRAF